MRRVKHIWTAVVAAHLAVAAGALPSGLAAPKTDPAAEDQKDQALEIFAQSETLYNEGKFSEAAALLEQAWALHKEPLLLYNLARAREGNGEAGVAADAYQAYLDQAQDIEGRGAIEQRIVNLREQERMRLQLEQEQRLAQNREAKDRQAKKQPSPAAPSEGAAEGSSVLAGPVPWVVAGAGVLGVGAGVVLGVLAKGKHADAVSEPVQADAVDLQDSAEGLALGANVAFIAGGTVALLGVVVGIVGLATDDGEALPADATTTTASSLRFDLGPAGGNLRVRF